MAQFGTLSPAEEAERPDELANMLAAMAGHLVRTPQRAFQASEAMRGGYGYDPGPMVDAAMLPMGTGAMAGVPATSAEMVLGTGMARMKRPGAVPNVAERYPEVAPPVMAIDKTTGKEYLAKELSPEALQVKEARQAAQRDIDKGNYEPYFDPAKRFDVDPAGYPPVESTHGIRKARADTQAKYEEHARNPEAMARLDEAYQRGLAQADDAGNWYHMGQLEAEFIKEYGPTEGRRLFKERFADAMAATTGGADPTSNYMMAHYGNYLRARGEPIPAASNEFPYPIGGRYASGNMAQYDKMINQGAGLTPENPKRYNFAGNFTGSKGATIDEQMSGLFDPQMQMPRAGSYGHYEAALADRAAAAGVDPRYYQEVAWAGAKDAKTKGGYKAKPMISHVNEAIERTHRITGMPREEIVRRGLVRAEVPLYALASGIAGPAVFGSFANRDE